MANPNTQLDRDFDGALNRDNLEEPLGTIRPVWDGDQFVWRETITAPPDAENPRKE